jgi:hypothetical protein
MAGILKGRKAVDAVFRCIIIHDENNNPLFQKSENLKPASGPDGASSVFYSKPEEIARFTSDFEIVLLNFGHRKATNKPA